MLLENIKLIKKLTKLMFDPKALQKSAILGVLALTSLSGCPYKIFTVVTRVFFAEDC